MTVYIDDTDEVIHRRERSVYLRYEDGNEIEQVDMSTGMESVHIRWVDHELEQSAEIHLRKDPEMLDAVIGFLQEVRKDMEGKE